MSKQDKEQVIENFSAAYKAANGKSPSIEAKGGWYSVDGGKNVRLAALEEMTAEMSSTKPVAKSPEKAAAPKAEKKADKKPAKKKVAPKAKASGFSVKAFWNEQITASNPGSKLPR